MKKLSFLRMDLRMLLAGLAAAFIAAPGAAQTISLIDLNTNIWRFSDSNTPPSADWKNPGFANDFAWKSGVGLLGVETTAAYPYPVPIRTPVVIGGSRMTHYFRTRFNVPQNPGNLVVSARAYVDDGAVFYVNGTEVDRVRITNNPVYFTNRAQVAAGATEGVPFNFSVPSGLLAQGDNVFAVEVHQNDPSSSDMVFGMELLASVVQGPVITNLNEPADRTLNQGDSTVLVVEGTGTPAPAYFWYRNNTLLAGEMGPSVTLNNIGPAQAGAYYAVLSNFVGMATSRTAQVIVRADTTPPAILYALALDDSTQVRVRFTEAPLEETASDGFNWQIATADGSAVLFTTVAQLTDGTNLTLTTLESRDPALQYVLRNTVDIPDGFGNAIPADTVTPVASFAVPVVRLDSSHTWRFEQSGNDLGTTWRNSGFDDSAWTSGYGPFDAYRSFENSPPPLCRDDIFLADFTTIQRGQPCISLSNANSSAQLSASYFRTHFNFAGDAAHCVLKLDVLLDDGAVLYLNGKELCRTNMPAGTVTNGTLANYFVFNPEFVTFELDANDLLQGDNVLAAEVHQNTLDSPDLTFGARLSVIAPSVGLAAAASGGNLNIFWQPAMGRLQAAAEISGPWSDVTPSQPPNQHSEPLSGARKFFRVVTP